MLRNSKTIAPLPRVVTSTTRHAFQSRNSRESITGRAALFDFYRSVYRKICAVFGQLCVLQIPEIIRKNLNIIGVSLCTFNRVLF